MNLVNIYESLCDRTRLRIMNLLVEGPLCVCHFQEVLDEPQVKISKHLGYLRRAGLVEAERSANWMVYQLPAKCPTVLARNLACLRACAVEEAECRSDLARLKKVVRTASPLCAPRAVCGSRKAGRKCHV